MCAAAHASAAAEVPTAKVPATAAAEMPAAKMSATASGMRSSAVTATAATPRTRVSGARQRDCHDDSEMNSDF
jgi:hypothetical protein